MQKHTILENVIRYFSPNAALYRAQARLALSIVDDHQKRRFEGASKGFRHSQWSRPGTSADAALLNNLPLLRNSARDLTRNNPWAEKALTVIENNTVGTGIKGIVTSTTKNKTKKLTEAWNEWAGTSLIDAEERLDIVGIQGLAIRTIAESGEVLIRRRFRRSSEKLPIPIQLQVLEPDYLDSTKDADLANGNYIKGGIEFNARGRPVAYHLYEEHPGDVSGFRNSFNSNRIPAADIIHAFNPKRAGQSRGYPWVAAAIKKLKDFDDYEDAQLVRQKIAACFAAFVYDMQGASNPTTGLDSEGNPAESDLDYLNPGTIQTLPPGKDIKFPSPPPVQNYDEYTVSILRACAAAWGISYESLTGDYSKVNFSSGRMGWIEMSRNITRWQNSIMRVQILEQIARWFFTGAGLMGLDTGGAKIKWTYPRREMIDPTREVPAMIKQIRAGLTTLPRALASMGHESEEILLEIAETNKILDENDLVLDSDPRRVNISGSNQKETNQGQTNLD